MSKWQENSLFLEGSISKTKLERESSSQRLKVAGGWLGSYYYYWKILWLFAAHSVALKSKKVKFRIGFFYPFVEKWISRKTWNWFREKLPFLDFSEYYAAVVVEEEEIHNILHVRRVVFLRLMSAVITSLKIRSNSFLRPWSGICDSFEVCFLDVAYTIDYARTY